MIGSKRYPMDDERVRELAGATYDRGHHRAGTGRQLAAIIASGDRTRSCAGCACRPRSSTGAPTRWSLPRPAAPRPPRSRTRELVAIPGMGHDLPREVWPQLIDAVAETAGRATAAQAA